jgi:hypothetical protein
MNGEKRMTRIWSTTSAALLIAATAACASYKAGAPSQPVSAASSVSAAPRAMPPAPAMPDVAGEWSWSATVGGNLKEGTMHLDHAPPSGYSGALQVEGLALPVKEFVVTGRSYTFKVEAPDGIYTLKGTLTDDKTMDGTLDGPPGPGAFKAKKS